MGNPISCNHWLQTKVFHCWLLPVFIFSQFQALFEVGRNEFQIQNNAVFFMLELSKVRFRQYLIKAFKIDLKWLSLGEHMHRQLSQCLRIYIQCLCIYTLCICTHVWEACPSHFLKSFLVHQINAKECFCNFAFFPVQS